MRVSLCGCHHHHHTSFMELGHLLTRSGLTYPEVSSKVYHYSFCQLGSSISLPWVIYFEAFYLHIPILFIHHNSGLRVQNSNVRCQQHKDATPTYLLRGNKIILCYNQQMHNYLTNYHTPTCFDAIVSSSGSL